jgi:hypothetical protein
MSISKKLLQVASGNAGSDNLYVEDVFSTYLYGGNGTSQTITNGIDLDGNGGLVWIKDRTVASNHVLFRLPYTAMYSNTTGVEVGRSGVTAYNSDGFSVGNYGWENATGNDYASWTFRKAEKFFDVVTYTSNGQSGQTISHSLGSVPGMILVKRTDGTSDWISYNSTGSAYKQMVLNTNAANNSDKNFDQIATDSTLKVGHIGGTTGVGELNGQTCVAYLFASDAGGFGDDGSESIIKCGSWDATGNDEVNLGFEPQWILIKNADGTNNWGMFDSMRGWTADGNIQTLPPNLSSSESSENGVMKVTSTGFTWVPAVSGNTYIYIAIRRPMKTPESGTEVFSPVAYSGNGSGQRTIDLDLTLDMLVTKGRNATIENIMYNRLSGTSKKLITSSSANEASSSTNVLKSLDQEGITIGSDVDINGGSYTYMAWAFKRAKGFFDTVMYTGNGVAGNTITHNLGVVPELIITKSRSLFFGGSWRVFSAYLNGETNPWEYELDLASTSSESSSERMNNTAPTSTVFSLNDNALVNSNNYTYVAHLFASVEGVSKVGTYTGTGDTGTNVIDCGFSAGARFVLIKKVSGNGDWYCFDTARGITDGNAGIYFQWNRTNAEVSNSGNVNIDPNASGFEFAGDISSNYLNTLNETYIFLAIA